MRRRIGEGVGASSRPPPPAATPAPEDLSPFGASGGRLRPRLLGHTDGLRSGWFIATLLLVAAALPAAAPARQAAAGPSAQARPLPASALGDLVTFGYGDDRSGADPTGPAIDGLSAAPAWDAHLDGAVYGQPLVYDGRVYVATEDDTIYALSAATGRTLWRLQVGNPLSLSVVDTAPTLGNGCGDIDPLGITGTPVIDPSRGELFADEETQAFGAGWQGIRHWVIAVSLATHRELWHRDVDPPDANRSGSYYIPAEQQRGALTLANGRLYVPFGGLIGDCGQYHGYVVGVGESGSGPLASYQVATQREGAIWGTEGTLVSAQGDIYVATGNGSSNSAFDEGDAVIELSPTLARLGIWAPSNWAALNSSDADLGSSGPITVPGSSLLFEAGKLAPNGSFGYLMREGALGGVGRGAFTGSVCQAGGVFGADAATELGSGHDARVLVFAPCGGGTEALQVNVGAMTFHRLWSGAGGANGSPIVAGGLVWALNWNSGQLDGMQPTTGRVVVERATDALVHFVAPAAAEGMLLVPTAGGVEAFRALG